MATASSQAESTSVHSSQSSQTSSNTEESSIYTSCSSDGNADDLDIDATDTSEDKMFHDQMPPRKKVRHQ